ncbi:MAG: hypothetical protein ACE3JR_12775 [Ectobacillus sp.]
MYKYIWNKAGQLVAITKQGGSTPYKNTMMTPTTLTFCINSNY